MMHGQRNIKLARKNTMFLHRTQHSLKRYGNFNIFDHQSKTRIYSYADKKLQA